MARLIIPDTCSIGAALFNEPASTNATPLLSAIRLLSVESAVPAVFLPEFMNICRKKFTGWRGAPPIAAPIVDGVFNDMLALPLIWVPIDPYFTREAWSLYTSRQIETNDAYFLFLAIQMDGEIWTTDSRFMNKVKPFYSKIFDLNEQIFA